jgi:RNA polymerase sigma-70 factor (ECF subfamily)
MSGKPEALDDSKAILECLEGNLEAFEHIVEKYKKPAYYLALRLTGNAEDAHDLSQEAFIKAFRALKSFKIDCDFKVWFFQILRNTCISHLRSRSRRKTEVFDDAQHQVLDAAPNPEDETGSAEKKKALWKAINNLTPVRKEAFVLREFEGLSYNEIAKITGATIEQVKSRIHYARNKLIEEMEKYLK